MPTSFALHLHEDEPCRVPYLVGESAVALGAGFAEGDVGTRRGHAGQREAHGIRPVVLDDLDGIDHIALGL